MTTFVAGCVLGVSASLHCAAMCGPLVLAARARLGGGIGPALAYHGARMAAYLALVLPAAWLGEGLTTAGFARSVATICGVVLLSMAAGVEMPSLLRDPWSRALMRASRAVNRVRPNHPLCASALAGLVNGWLPCGLVYPAVVAATALGDLGAGLQLMAGFGAGTLPALLVLAWLPSVVPTAVRGRLRPLAPAALALTGLLVIYRGHAGDHECGEIPAHFGKVPTHHASSPATRPDSAASAGHGGCSSTP